MTQRHLTQIEPHRDGSRRGYRAACLCGWRGRHRADPKRAREDATDHREREAKP